MTAAPMVTRERTVAVPASLGALCAVLVVGGFSLEVFLPNLHNGLIAVSFTAVGVFIQHRRPGNREGWLFVAVGLTEAVVFFGRQYGAASEALPGASWVAWIGVWPTPLVVVLTGYSLMCFPTGRLPSPRWRPVVVAMLVVGAVLSLASALWPIEYADNSLSLPYPFQLGGYEVAQRVWNTAGPFGYLLLQLAWVACVAVRMWHARADESRQLRWFAYAVGVEAVAMVTGLLAFGSPALGVLTVPVIPLAAGAAIVKYRLYDIDLVINKTLVVGAMAALITTGYAAVVVGAGRLVGGAGGTGGAGGNGGTSGNGGAGDAGWALPLLATALVAIAFEPVRRRVQRWADRLVYGDRPSPYETLARLSEQLSGGGQDTDLFSGVASTVADGVGAAAVTLWVGTERELVAVASWPPADADGTPAPRDLASLDDSGRAHVRPIVHQGVLRGAVTLTKAPGDALTASEDRLLRDIVAQTGLVIDNVGLGAELQQRLHQITVQAADLRAAARRIVAAQYEARRRIERDLHDGAQQRLVTLALTLRSASERAEATGDADLAARMSQARDQLSRALAELREMARGIHPAILTQDGLEAALGYLAERAPLPVRLDVHLDRRLPQDAESTAYFVVSEALTNAAKHANASEVAVRGRLVDDRLRIDICDDGRGGADGHWGSGLQGLADRLAAASGRLTVHSPAGGGTRLSVDLPCG